MTPNNHFGVLPFYTSIEQQNARKWWLYDKVYPLFTPSGTVLPFQIMVPITEDAQILEFAIYDKNNTRIQLIDGQEIIQKKFNGYSVLVFGDGVVIPALENGQYYVYLEIDTDTQGTYEYWSEMYTNVNDISGYLKLEWWDDEDFEMDAGTIVYTQPAFKNILYLCSDIAKPEYIFNEEIIERDGYTFPVKQVSEKRYRFSFLASEYLLDALRFVRMSDHIRITESGQTYTNIDSFLISPEWEKNGDVAVVNAEFTTDTVAKKNGRGAIAPTPVQD